jgi:hypothetical protein
VFHADLELLSLVDQIKRKRQPKTGSSDAKPPQPIRYEETMNAVVWPLPFWVVGLPVSHAYVCTDK